jgi:DNA-binding GntR family transcriptional regulator
LDRARRLARREVDLSGHSYGVLREHREIATAIIAQDEERAANLMAQHLDGAFHFLEYLALNRPDVFADQVPDNLGLYRTPLAR